MWIVIKTHPEPESLWSRVIREEPIYAGAVGPFSTRIGAEKYANSQEQIDEDHLYDVVKVNSITEEVVNVS